MAKTKSKLKGKKPKTKKEFERNVPTECEGYKVMRLKTFKHSDAIHFVFAKEHTTREKCPEKPQNRTIFVRNIPPFADEEGVRNAFGCFGVVANIYFHSAPCAGLPPLNQSPFFVDVHPLMGYKVAYIVYAKESGARQAMLSPSDVPLILSPNGPSSESLIQTLVNRFNKNATTDITALKKDVDEYMLKYDAASAEKKIIEKNKLEEEQADDGWITVTKKTGIPRKESVHKQIMKKQDSRAKKTQLMNFYRFQIRESKMNQLVKLREKFEEDKKRITQLKESRKFKPF